MCDLKLVAYEYANGEIDLVMVNDYFYPKSPTALPTIHGKAVNVHKALVNGQLIIRKENKNYSVLGQEL